MKNRVQRKIFIVGISILTLLVTKCDTSKSGKALNPDEHPLISEINYTSDVIYNKSEYPIIDPDEITIDSLFIQVAYKLNSNRNLLIARKIENDTEGLKLLIIDPNDNNKLIYRSKGSFESMTLHPTFFIPNDMSRPSIILCNIGMLESWGQRFFIMDGDTVNDIGYIDIAAKFEADSSYTEKGYELKDIGPYSNLAMAESGFHLSFNTDSIIYFGGKGELIDPIIEANKLEYIYYDGVLRIIWND